MASVPSCCPRTFMDTNGTFGSPFEISARPALPMSTAGPAASPRSRGPAASACFPHHGRLALGHQGAAEQVPVRAVDGLRQLERPAALVVAGLAVDEHRIAGADLEVIADRGRRRP